MRHQPSTAVCLSVTTVFAHATPAQHCCYTRLVGIRALGVSRGYPNSKNYPS
ncbi:MAG: hypothetical protein LIP09_07855 [Bacteroidales bacterium]|nr:hypothetical protein [Bacteroidales bacterium]